MALQVLICVGIMLFYAIPGFLLIKSKLIKPDTISGFAKLLMYVCQPFFTIYAFQKCTFSWNIFWNLLICFALAMLVETALLFAYYFILKKKFEDVKYRIYNVACCFGNCLFIGLPIIETILPENAEANLYSNMFFLAMSLLGWTVASFIISQDKKYIKVKKISLNPAVISIIIASFFFFLNIKLPSQLFSMCEILGKMSTPLCMLIMGMRLATNDLKEIFLDYRQYIVVLLKQLVMPLITFLIVWFLPIDYVMKVSLIILSATPIAAVVQNFAEMIGQGQKESANLVLLGTLLSVGTIPLVSLLINLL